MKSKFRIEIFEWNNICFSYDKEASILAVDFNGKTNDYKLKELELIENQLSVITSIR